MDQLKHHGLLLLLLLSSVRCSADLQSVVKAVGDSIVMDFCFGKDYTVGYKLTNTGLQLLVNSSGGSHSQLDGRVKVVDHVVFVLNLTAADSGVYLWQCWRVHQLVTEMKHYLYVCGEEATAKEISLSSDGGAVFTCDASRTTLPGISIRWYREVYPEYKAALFLDTRLSLTPLQPELRDDIQVGDHGSSLRISASVMRESHNFHCLILRGSQCLAFQTIEMPKTGPTGVKTIFRALGESMQLRCTTEQSKAKRYWETPFGRVDVNTQAVTAERNHLRVKEGEYLLVATHLNENHRGHYKCFSPQMTANYAVNICPKHESVTEEFEVGGKVGLSCMPQKGYVSIQWYREDGPNEETLLVDTEDPTIELPNDLEGRALYSELKHTLTITRLTPKDSRKYWCVILEGALFTPEDYSGSGDSGSADVDGMEEDMDLDAEYDPDDFGSRWHKEHKCLSRREIWLKAKDRITKISACIHRREF